MAEMENKIVRNIIVSQLIEHLKTLDQNAIVCRIIDHDYSSIELIRQDNDVFYDDDLGNRQFGNVVGIY